MADFGFLGVRLSNSDDPSGHVEISTDVYEEQAEEEEQPQTSTIGQPGYGKVINGMDAVSEKALFNSLLEGYGIPVKYLIKDIFMMGTVASSLLGVWMFHGEPEVFVFGALALGMVISYGKQN